MAAWLIFENHGPRAPVGGEPNCPSGSPKYLGHVHYGARVPYDVYEVCVDDAGVFWARRAHAMNERTCSDHVE